MNYRGGGAPENSSLRGKKAGFTLAEVLITLGILGVVIAMTLPTLYNRNLYKTLDAGLKKNYTIILQAFDLYYAKNGEKLTPDIIKGNGTDVSLKSLIMPYFKVLIDCGANGENNPKECITLNSPYKTFNGQINRTIAAFDDGQFVIEDGSIILIEDMQGRKYKFISVDVNGRNKNPNRWGYDLFTFELMDNGQILPMGAPETRYTDKNEYCSQTSTNVYNGIACTYYAINEKNYFTNLSN